MRRGIALTLMVISQGFAMGADEESPLPDSQLGRRTANILLLTRPDVLADLGMTLEQARVANKIATDFWLRADSLKKKPNENPSQQTIQQRQALNREMQRWIETQLSADQKNRLRQIDLWWEGPSALISRPFVGDHLRLTAEQKIALGEALAQREQARKSGPAQEREVASKAMKLLTPEQLLLWKELLGREFVPQLAATSNQSTQTR